MLSMHAEITVSYQEDLDNYKVLKDDVPDLFTFVPLAVKELLGMFLNPNAEHLVQGRHSLNST